MKKCEVSETYDACNPPVCRPPCKACLKKWEKTLLTRSSAARKDSRNVR